MPTTRDPCRRRVVAVGRHRGRRPLNRAPSRTSVAQDWTDPMSATFILYRWDGGAELREVARGIAAIAW